MAGADRTIAVLKLFTLERPEWTAEELAVSLGVSASSAYRYVSALGEAGLLTSFRTGRYSLGPAIIQYDRQVQLTDPLLRVARPVMDDLLRYAPPDSTVLLCRLFGDRVLCVDQRQSAGGRGDVSYERGRPMPLLRGATSKVILAHLPLAELRRMYATQADAIAANALGGTWEEFRTAMATIRRAGGLVTHAEVDSGRTGISAPIFDDRRHILGSLSFVVPSKNERSTTSLLSLVVSGANDIHQTLGSNV